VDKAARRETDLEFAATLHTAAERHRRESERLVNIFNRVRHGTAYSRHLIGAALKHRGRAIELDGAADRVRKQAAELDRA